MKQQTDRGIHFLKSVGVYAIGNIGSKLITFLMIPLYTFFVDAADFGYYDLCLNTVMLLATFASLQLRDGAFRFLVDCKTEPEQTRVVSVSLKLLARSFAISLLVTLLMALFYPVRCLWLSFALMLSIALLEVVGQMARGVGRTEVFVTSNIISAFSIGALSVVLVAWCGWGINGIFIANILARLIAVAYIELRTGLARRHFKPAIKDKRLTADLLRYVIPLIPSIVCWWLTTCSDRFFIQHFFTLSDNGIYAVAARFGAILQIVGTIIFQAWQETALRQYGSPDRDAFFSKMMNMFIVFLSAALICFAFGLKIVYPYIVNKEYVGGIVYVFPLAAAAILYALSTFLEMGYQCSRETKRALPGIAVAAAVNLPLNYVLVQTVGIFGVVITSMATYAVLLAFRLYDSRRYFRITFSRKSLAAAALAAASAAPFYLTDSLTADALIIAAGCGAMATLAPGILRKR